MTPPAASTAKLLPVCDQHQGPVVLLDVERLVLIHTEHHSLHHIVSINRHQPTLSVCHAVQAG